LLNCANICVVGAAGVSKGVRTSEIKDN